MTERVSFVGAASGLDTRAIVEALLAKERVPIAGLSARIGKANSKQKALAELKSVLGALDSSLLGVRRSTELLAKKATTDTASGTAPFITAAAGPSAATGSFKVLVDQLATVTKRVSTAAVGPAVDKTAVLTSASAGWVIQPTVGTFTVNGHEITIDSSTVLSNGVDGLGANTIVAKIQDATAGDVNPVTVTLVADANGTAENAVRLTSNAQVTLGAGSDTSNFLSAAGLAAAPSQGAGPYTRTSTRPIGGTIAGVALDSSRISGLTSTASGELEINGVSIAYDTTVDSLTAVLNRINSSGAGVSATYDAGTDKVTVVSTTTGSTAITVADVTGNLAAKLNVLAGGSQTLGVNAQYQIDTGSGYVTRYSTSNTVGDAVTGVSLNLLRETGVTPVAVTVSRDTDRTVAAVKSFVDAFNTALDKVNDLTAKGALLQGDSSVAGIADQFRRIASEKAQGVSGTYQTLWSVGVSFGVAGSAVGTANELTLDESKLRDALGKDADAVARAFDARRATTALQGGGTSSVSTAAGDAAIGRSGTYRIVTTNAGSVKAYWTPSGGREQTTPLSGTITANGTNNTLIGGVTLTAGPALTNGTSYLTVTGVERGVAAHLDDYVSDLTLVGGFFDTRKDQAKTLTDRLQADIERISDRVTRKEKLLTEQFARLESVLAKLQSAQDLLAQQSLLLSSSTAGAGGGRRTGGSTER